ncbi:hypothetical protein Gromo_00403 [Candidatus Gromoviella agglomerans]|nr:hypothetical protein Gromo_00403 [Candidatus Gromoviella agglomerans]
MKYIKLIIFVSTLSICCLYGYKQLCDIKNEIFYLDNLIANEYHQYEFLMKLINDKHYLKKLNSLSKKNYSPSKIIEIISDFAKSFEFFDLQVDVHALDKSQFKEYEVELSMFCFSENDILKFIKKLRNALLVRVNNITLKRHKSEIFVYLLMNIIIMKDD